MVYPPDPDLDYKYRTWTGKSYLVLNSLPWISFDLLQKLGPYYYIRYVCSRHFRYGIKLKPRVYIIYRTCMGCPVLQGYGLTETTACATLMQTDEHSTGRVGPPVQGINIRYEYDQCLCHTHADGRA